MFNLFNQIDPLLTMQDAVNKVMNENQLNNQDNSNLENKALIYSLYKNKDNFLLEIELPGIKKEAVNIDAVNDLIRVHGSKEEPKLDNKETVHSKERFLSSFDRTFKLPIPFDSKNITAKLENGVLNILIPHAEAYKAKSITVN